jgi:hypothetical protein
MTSASAERSRILSAFSSAASGSSPRACGVSLTLRLPEGFWVGQREVADIHETAAQIAQFRIDEGTEISAGLPTLPMPYAIQDEK